jgi:hypothetical protein
MSRGQATGSEAFRAPFEAERRGRGLGAARMVGEGPLECSSRRGRRRSGTVT